MTLSPDRATLAVSFSRDPPAKLPFSSPARVGAPQYVLRPEGVAALAVACARKRPWTEPSSSRPTPTYQKKPL